MRPSTNQRFSAAKFEKLSIIYYLGPEMWRPGCGKGRIIPNCRIMKPLKLILFVALAAAVPAPAQQPEGDLTKIKEQELEDVRERISELKKNIDDRVAHP